MRYTLVVSGSIEQAVLAMQNQNISGQIVSAFYNEDENKTALKVSSVVGSIDMDRTLRQQLEAWQAERSTTGRLEFYSPYWGEKKE